MNCEEAQELKHAHLDGELDLVRSLHIEEHLKDCAACQAATQHLQGLRDAIRSEQLYFRAPAGLEGRIRATLRHEDRSPARPTPPLLWFWLRLAGTAAVIALVAWGIVLSLGGPTHADRLAQAITASHIRSLMAAHLTDVASSDQHTVKPWFDGRLDFAPTVVDLADHGFPLLGGRLDYLEDRPVAALVYQRQKHFINLFIWPSEGDAGTDEKMAAYHGYNLVHWRASGMACWAVSDLNRSELRDFAQLIRAQTAPASKP